MLPCCNQNTDSDIGSQRAFKMVRAIKGNFWHLLNKTRHYRSKAGMQIYMCRVTCDHEVQPVATGGGFAISGLLNRYQVIVLF